MVVDEVALEGLDGITIPSLWIRLEDRQPKFPLRLDEPTKGLIWRSLTCNTDLKFYELPQERSDVVLTDRFKNTDPETGIETAEEFSDTKEDIYPVHIILDNKDGIQGSCAFFQERTDITKQVHSKSLSLEEALERYGRKLVVVASQTLRFRTLIGVESDPDLKLNDGSYCVLERVGRARWQGELQSNLHGCSFKTDARKLHYMRMSLVKHGLISMHSHVRRLKSRQQQYSILLLLKRFYINRRSKYDLLMEQASNLLQQTPGQVTPVMALRQHLNVDERNFRRIFQCMQAAKLVESCQYPLEDLDPSAGPCANKRGNKVLVRCWKLLKPYTRKGIANDDDDDDDEEDDTGAKRRDLPSEGRIMEKDILSQAYNIVLSTGPKGITQSGIRFRMNNDKLESRMLCRRLERDGFVKGFMEDVGRQRTRRYISHKYVGVSNDLQLFAKEQERQKLLYSTAPQTADTAPATPKTPSTSESTAKENTKTPAVKKIKKAGRKGDKAVGEVQPLCEDRQVHTGDKGSDEEGGKTKGKSGARTKSTVKRGSVATKQPDIPIKQPTSMECETQASSESVTSITPNSEIVPTAGQAPVEKEKEAAENLAANNIVLVSQLPAINADKERNHETLRLLRRKNLIIEAVRNLRVIEGLFPLQKMINEAEKQDGVSSKCCRKSILRIINSLSREGLLKIYMTTIIQDGITKKLELVVHPSVQSSDDIVTQVIEQVRFRISSSFSTVRQNHTEENQAETTASTSRAQKSKADKSRASLKDDEQFSPTTVPGLGKTLGFQPKMHRLRVVHHFLWYLIYGHPLRHSCAGSHSTSETPANLHSSDLDVKHPDTREKQGLKDAQNVQAWLSEDAASSSVGVHTSNSNLDLTSGDEQDEPKDKSTPGLSQPNMKVYAEEESWKKFIPPARVHKELGSSWLMISDLLPCFPLSVFMQVTQINYKVDGLEEYLNDPVKQHYLVGSLPTKMRRQLLYKRKYIYSFHENLQRLVYMGLMQFGPMEKFKEKDQVFVYLRRNATIVDTTNAEPHYWLVTESPDKPFERRQYTFNTAEDVENYWFDLMCVCLNTPLGIIRGKRNVTEKEVARSFVHKRNMFAAMADLLKGSGEVCDDGSIPGDGKGAGGLHSGFFAHLKRNWFWTSHLLACKTSATGLQAEETKFRLKRVLSKNALRFALKAGGSTSPRCLTTKRPVVLHNIEVGIEPASRNQRVVGGKRQRRKRTKKEVIRVQLKKRKEPKKRTPAHDEKDHQALKMMTRQRVYWTVQEDSLLMLCCVAAHLLNIKLKRPFVPYCVVRDLLHAEFEVSMDKTSVAVARRSRYILKNPQTLLNYRICVAEVYQDKTLMRLLEEKLPTDPDKPEDCAESLLEHFKLLRQKFSCILSARDKIIPDTKQELFSRFKVSAIDSGTQVLCRDTLEHTDDIHAIVLHNLIQSTLAMTNSQMKSSRSFQTFHMYSKYNQELLCKVFIQYRKRGLVSRRRVNRPFGPKKSRALPILPMSYQLSQTYYRCFTWRFPHSLCTDSFHILRDLINNRTGNNRPVTAFYHETEKRSETGEEVLQRKTGSKRKEKQREGNEDGRAAAEGEKSQRNLEGEEMLMEVDMNKSEAQKNPEDCLPAGCADDPSSRGQTGLFGEEEASGAPAASNTARRVSEDPPDVSDMLHFSLDSHGGACLVSLSLMSLGLLSVYLSIPKQMVMVDSDVVKSMAALEEEDDDDDDDGEDCEGRKKLEVKAHQASHTKYLMMQGYCFPGIVKLRNLNTSDNIVVESCIMRLQLRNTPAHNMFVEHSLPLDLSKCGPSPLPSILTYSVRTSSFSPPNVKDCDRHLVQQRGYTPQDIDASAQLRRSLDEAAEKGLDLHDLYKALAHLEEPQSGCSRSLQQYLKDLEEEGQVLRVGSLGARWVLLQHAEPWLLTVSSKQWPQSRFTSDGLPFLENEHSIPFMRKRCRQEGQQEAEGPPEKKSAVDRQESVDGGDVERLSSDVIRENLNEEQHKEQADEGKGDELLNLEVEGGKKTPPEKEREQVQSEEIQEEKREQRPRRNSRNEERDEEACCPLTDLSDGENVSFISRPWRMVDGKLNRQVCKGMLEAVLYHIMSRPGLTQQTLLEHYKDVLQPMAVLELVQALTEMGCVTRKTLVKCPKPTLFARSVRQTEVKIEDPETVFYEPTISCCLRLSPVLPNEQHWDYCAL